MACLLETGFMENGKRNGFVNTLSEYSILDIIGKGTYGEVYKAIHITTGDVVALKKVNAFRIARSHCRFATRTSGFRNRRRARFGCSLRFGTLILKSYEKL